MASSDSKVPQFKRVMLKISGEALMGDKGFGLNPPTVERIAREVKSVHELGVEICMVIGGGNIFRGLQGSAQGMERTTADYMGMLATVMNALAMQSALESVGVYTRVLSAIPMDQISEPYIRRRAVRHLEKGRVVIFGCGTGNPFFTTDSAASLRAIEIDASVILKGTRVNGIYTEDPEKNPNAQLFDKLTFSEVFNKELKVMDMTAFTLCKENNVPIVVFNMNEPGNLKKVVLGDKIGTLVEV